MVYFQPEDGGPAIPLGPARVQEVMLPDQTIDPNLLLFGFGVLALLGFLGFIAYMARRS